MNVTLAAALCVFAFAPPAVDAQSSARHCDRASSRITFGTDGGNIRPVHTTIAADGTVTRSRDTLSTPESLPSIDSTAARALARLAWSGAVTAHRMTSTRPLANRDMAYDFIEVATPCERRRAEYQSDAPARFRELHALLEAVVKD